jgi:NAD(P)-dependent dehydrogenase (short-subunit alcohol dehydrogenase family)
MEFNDKVFIVTGASSGIGRAAARMAYDRGAKVSLVARREKELTALCSTFDAGRVEVIATDVTKDPDRRRIVDQTIKRFGGVDVLVNAAGIIANGTIENTTPEQWDEMMDINLRSVFRLMQAALPSIIERKGNIVNVSSVTGVRSFPNVLAYCVSKAGVDQLTRCTALELGPKGVRVNAVDPGVVVTNLHRTSGMDEEKYQKFLEHSKTTHPIGRVGTPEEVAELILFLASDRAGWITGGSFSIDGGRAQTCAR